MEGEREGEKWNCLPFLLLWHNWSSDRNFLRYTFHRGQQHHFFSFCLLTLSLLSCGPFHALHSFQQLRIFVPCYADCKNYFSGPNHNSKKETESLWHTNLKILIILIQLLTQLYEGPFYWKGRCFFIFSLVQTTAPCIWVYLFLFSTDHYCRDFMLDITKKYKQVVTMTLL